MALRAPVKEARALLAECLALRASLQAPPSPSGGQLEALRTGLCGDDDSVMWRRSEAGEHRLARFRRLTRLWMELTELEQAVVTLQNTPVETERTFEELRATVRDERRDLADTAHSDSPAARAAARDEIDRLAVERARERVASYRRRRSVHESDLYTHHYPPRVLTCTGPSSVKMTRSGEEFVCNAEEPGRAVVEERVTALLSNAQIGEVLGLTSHQVRSLIRSAYEKARAAAAEWE